MKLILKLVVLLVVLLVIGVVVTLYFVNHIAKSAVEKGATYALGVETTLGNADVRILKGEFQMNRLRVSNPEGYATPHFLTLGDGGMGVKLRTLRQETIQLPVLYLTDLDVNLEKKQGKNNYDVILTNLKRLSTGEKPAEEAPGQKHYVVDEVVIRNVNVHVDVLPIGGELTRLDLDIPEIRLTGIGSETDKGVVMSELTGIIIRAVFAAIVEKGGNILPTELLGDLSTGLADIGGNLGKFGIEVAGEALGGVGGLLEGVGGGAGEGAGKALEDVGKAVEEGIGGIGKGITDLFGGDKK